MWIWSLYLYKEFSKTWHPLVDEFNFAEEYRNIHPMGPQFQRVGVEVDMLGTCSAEWPQGTHSLFMYFQQWLSSTTKSRRKEYMALGSRPDVSTFSTRNILLLFLGSIIWLVSSVKYSHLQVEYHKLWTLVFVLSKQHQGFRETDLHRVVILVL